MIHIQRFIDKMSIVEAKMSKDVVMTINDARGLRDEIAKLLVNLHELTSAQSLSKQDEIIQVEIRGGTFK